MKPIAFISCLFNQVGFKTPLKNCYNFLKHTVGNTIPDDDFFFAQIEGEVNLDINGLVDKSKYLKLKTDSVLWHKERMLNLLIQKFELLERYKFVAWIDCDVVFRKPVFISDDCELIAFQPFSYSYRSKCPRNIDYSKEFFMDGDKYESFGLNKKNGDVGLSWIINSEYLDEIGGYFDYGIVGGGDTYFIRRALGEKVHSGCSSLDKYINEYAEYAEIKKKEIGCIPGEIYHQYHGKLVNRNYQERMQILRKHEFDPLKDLEIEKNGLYRLKNKDFEEDVRQFFLGRKEDEGT